MGRRGWGSIGRREGGNAYGDAWRRPPDPGLPEKGNRTPEESAVTGTRCDADAGAFRSRRGERGRVREAPSANPVGGESEKRGCGLNRGEWRSCPRVSVSVMLRPHTGSNLKNPDANDFGKFFWGRDQGSATGHRWGIRMGLVSCATGVSPVRIATVARPPRVSTRGSSWGVPEGRHVVARCVNAGRCSHEHETRRPTGSVHVRHRPDSLRSLGRAPN